MADPGRPTVMTEATIQKLEEGFSKGLNVLQACLYADISKSTYYDYLKANPDFSDRVDLLKEKTSMHAVMNLSDAVMEGSKDDSWKWATVRVPEFKPKQQTEVDASISINVVSFADAPDADADASA